MSDLAGPSQALRLTIENRTYQGVIVSMSEEVMLVATTIKDKPDLPIGAIATGEMPKPDGLYQFATRVKGFQMLPMLVVILERPKSMRKVQRRAFDRYPVAIDAHLIFISADKSLNEDVQVTNLSQGGIELQVPEAPPLGYHCIVQLDLHGDMLNTICQTVHSAPRGAGMRLGLSFVEMSRPDRERLHAHLTALEQSARPA